jgi:hypothetical protein
MTITTPSAYDTKRAIELLATLDSKDIENIEIAYYRKGSIGFLWKSPPPAKLNIDQGIDHPDGDYWIIQPLECFQ